MKKWIAISFATVLLGTSGCINSSRYNESMDDIWIQQQVESGQTIPQELRQQ